MAGFSYDRYDSRRRATNTRQRSVFGYWIPFAVTATLAAGALAAWVFSARDDHESITSDDDENLSYGGDTDRERDTIRPPSYGVSEGITREEQTGETGSAREDTTLLGRVQSTIRRTPSPQQIFDGASKKVAAGVAAAGAAVGGALTAIREDKEDDFADHERWREQSAASRASESAKKATSAAAGRRRTVAIVVSAEEGDVTLEEEEEKGWKSEHASLLSHIPPVDASTTNLIILIFAPRHQPHASTAGAANPGALSSLASSYSAINTPAATPGEELSAVDPMPITPALSARSSGSSFYDMIYKQASRLVSAQAAIMPFSTPSGHVHMLKHLSPDVVYVADSLSGPSGKHIEDIRGWVGQIVVVVGGDGAGLVDDTEDEMAGSKSKSWWETSQYVGLGKGIEVVEAVRVSDDWERRVGGRD